MSNPVHNLFADKDYCMQTIKEARTLWSDKNTTKKQFAYLFESLGMALLYCPEDLSEIIRNTLHEATIREGYFIRFKWSDYN